ncbi:MAG TPA: hypothetical protein VET48_02320, partial [Steroidobacteraceae bacterium]|nr:hypothetical protein [Steroidobacteraceae bacterium]
MKYALFPLVSLLVAAEAQTNSEPQPLPLPQPIVKPQDIAYPGTMTLFVDATDLDHRIYRIKQTIPIPASGPMVLWYSQWIPGTHAAIGPIHDYAGLKFSANGQPVKWSRDPVEVYAFHVDVPPGVQALDIEAQMLTPAETAQGAIVMTPEMLRLNWFSTALYPAGYFARRISVNASVKLPAGWQFGTALETESKAGDVTIFKTVSFETLVDSPLYAGKYFKKIELDTSGRSRVTLNVMADDAAQLEAKSSVMELHRELVRQADKLFGARHYDHYDFLLSLSDHLAGAGVEHQRSSDNGTSSRYFTAWDTAIIARDLLAHEYSHSWNGKYRRPADLWTPNFNVPMRTSLLWVYEGQTQYWGQVLAARAGFLTKEEALDSWALTAAQYDARVGRTWRSLQDTTNDPLLANRRPIPWSSWQRSEDYYSEGQLVWLEVDTLIRELSKNKRSLDDFAHAFFGINDGDWGQFTYTFDDIVSELNKVQPYDWAGFLRTRLDENAEHAPLAGLERGGYRLVYSEIESEYAKASAGRRKGIDFTYSLGF